MSKPVAICLIVVIVVVVSPVILPLVFMVPSMFISMWSMSRKESAMLDPKVYEPVGRTLALYSQSDHTLFPDSMGYAWLPPELSRIGQGSARVYTNGAAIEMGGGFHHFGYLLDLDTNLSVPGTNVWQLSTYSEGSKKRPLYTLSLPADSKLSPETLLPKVLEGFNAAILKDPKDVSAYKGRIRTCLRFNAVPEARESCRDLLHALPKNSWAVLVNALLLCEEQSVEIGTELMLNWVKERESFDRYLELAYFYQLTNRPREAAAAVIKSTEFNAGSLLSEMDGNSEFRGYTAAMCAYLAGDYAASLKLCDHLLPLTINGDYFKQGLRDVRAASEKAQQGQVEPLPWNRSIGPYDPFEKIDIEKLLGREVPRPVEKKES